MTSAKGPSVEGGSGAEEAAKMLRTKHNKKINPIDILAECLASSVIIRFDPTFGDRAPKVAEWGQVT